MPPSFAAELTALLQEYWREVEETQAAVADYIRKHGRELPPPITGHDHADRTARYVPVMYGRANHQHRHGA